MATSTEIDDLIRLRLRSIRNNRGLNMRDVAERAGIPLSTYAAMERGACGVKAARLFKALEAMGADPSDVWPYADLVEIMRLERDRDLRFQEYRIHELTQMLEARAAALLAVEGGKASVLLTVGLSPEGALRLACYLELGSDTGEETYRCRIGEREIVLVISEAGNNFDRRLVDYFLEKLARAFSEDNLLLQAAKDRHPQP